MTAHITALVDQLAADLRDRRCCDPFRPCLRCQVAREMVAVGRHLDGGPDAEEARGLSLAPNPKART